MAVASGALLTVAALAIGLRRAPAPESLALAALPATAPPPRASPLVTATDAPLPAVEAHAPEDAGASPAPLPLRPSPLRAARSAPTREAAPVAPAAPETAPAATPEPAPETAPVAPAVVAAPPPPPLPAPPAAPAPPPSLHAFRATAGSVTLGGGVGRGAVQSRVDRAAEGLSQCALRAAGTREVGDEPIRVSVEVDVRDRRLDALRRSGGPSWLAGCDDALREAFRGELPEAEDTEYTVRFAVTLTPAR